MTVSTKRSKRSFATRVLAGFAWIVALQSGFLIVLLMLLEDSEKRLDEERHARSVVSAIAKVTSTVQFCSLTLLNQTLVNHMEEKKRLLADYKSMFERLPRDVNALKSLLQGNPQFDDRVIEIEDTTQEALVAAEKVQHSSSDRATPQKEMLHWHYCVQVIDASRALSSRLDDLESAYREIEKQVSESVTSQSGNLPAVLSGLGFLLNALVAIFLFLFLFMRGITDRLRIVNENTLNLIVGKPLLAPVSGDDELADLDRTFREMAKSIEDLRSKEAAILEHAANFICSMNAKGVFLSVPPSSSSRWGYSPEDLIGRRFSSIVKGDEYESTLRALETLMEFGKSTSFENQVRRADGTIVDLFWTANLSSDSTIVCVANDITERNRITKLIRESEKRFSAIIEHLPVAVIGCDRLFVIESANPVTTAMFQYKLNELLGKRLDVLLAPPSNARRSEFSEELNQVTELALKRTAELNVWRRDERQVPVELDISAYSAPHGERYLACFRDISPRIELELAKNDFVSMIGHDLRSPLMSVYGTLGLIASGIDSGASDGVDHGECAVEPQSGFREAEKIVEDLVNLINDFLDLGKIESGQYSFAQAETALTDLLLESIRLLESSRSDEQQMAISLPDLETTCHLRIDQDRLSSAFACILETVVHFCDDNKKVSIEYKVAEQIVTIRLIGSSCHFTQALKDTCVEGYSLIELGGAMSSGLRFALARAIILAHRGSLTVISDQSCDLLEVKLPLS